VEGGAQGKLRGNYLGAARAWESGPVKVTEDGETKAGAMSATLQRRHRKPERSTPVNPDRAVGGRRAVGPPTRAQQLLEDGLRRWRYWHKHLGWKADPRPR